MAALRYNADGTLDNSFGKEGRSLIAFTGLRPQVTAVLLQPDGRLILCGNAYGQTANLALGLTTDGSPDPSFCIEGKQLTTFSGGDPYSYCATLQQDGKNSAGRQLLQ